MKVVTMLRLLKDIRGATLGRAVGGTRARLRKSRYSRELYGRPCSRLAYPFWLLHDYHRWGRLGHYIALSRRIPGWTRGEEAVSLAQASASLPYGAVIVEIGSFLGSSTVLLAGARKLCGSGEVHCVDPFDASGDAFSAPVYHKLADSKRSSLRRRFDANIHRAGLDTWVKVNPGQAHDVAETWTGPVDLLFMDGDQSPEGVQIAYESWSRFLKPNSVIALHNSRSGASYSVGHDGHMRLAQEVLRPPDYDEVNCVGTITFARKTSVR